MTTTAQTEDALLAALKTIRTLWPALMLATTGGSLGVASSDEVTPLDRRISLRHEVTLTLNGWARVIVDDRNVKPWQRCDHGVTVTLRWPHLGPTATRCAARIQWAVDDDGVPQSGLHAIDGADTEGLCLLLERHATWFSGHEAALDALEELASAAAQVRLAAIPERREWMPLGTCPLEVESDEGLATCGGQVRAYPGHDPRCVDCGTEAVAAWWERVMFPDAETSELVTADDLVLLLHRAFGGSPIKPSTIRQWIRREVIEAAGKDPQGRTLFNRADVIRRVAERTA